MGALVVIGFYIMLFALAAAGEPTSPEEEMRCIREMRKKKERREAEKRGRRNHD